MRSVSFRIRTLAASALLMFASGVTAQDWPQWRGPNRDGKAPGFKAPATWPASLTKKWDVPVGEGDAGASLVGERLFVFSREGGDEVIRALDGQTGQQAWSEKYPATPQLSGDRGHAGPRCPPTVADGKVITYGIDGMLTCWNVADGKQVWQKNEFVGKSPTFHTSSAPIVVDGLCIAQLGGARGTGAMVAYELATGNEKWRVSEGSGSYGSPVLMTVDGTKVIIGPSETNLVAVRASDGKLMWQLPYKQGRYNAATPIVDGQTLVIAGPENGITVLKMKKEGDALKEEEVAPNKYTETSVLYNTPVLKDGMLFGLSTNNQLFCIVDVMTPQPKTAWTAPIGRPAGVGRVAPLANQAVFAQQEGERRGGGQPGRGPRRGRGGGGSGGYGSVIDAGSVLLALSEAAELVVYKPSKEAFSEVARYKMSEDGQLYAHPVVSGNRIFVKDRDSIALWTVE